MHTMRTEIVLWKLQAINVVDYVNAMGLNRFCPTWLRMWNCCASIDFGSLSKQLTLLTNIDSISYYYTAFTPNNPCKLYAILNGIFTSIGVCAVLKSSTAQCTCWLLCWKCKCRTFYKVNRVNTHTPIPPLSLYHISSLSADSSDSNCCTPFRWVNCRVNLPSFHVWKVTKFSIVRTHLLRCIWSW